MNKSSYSSIFQFNLKKEEEIEIISSNGRFMGRYSFPALDIGKNANMVIIVK